MDDCFSDCSAGSSTWSFLFDPSLHAKKTYCHYYVLQCLRSRIYYYLSLGLFWKFFLDKYWPILLVSVISLIDLGRFSPNNNLECSPCGKDKCLYTIFSSGVILSLRIVNKSWLSFPNIMAESAHFFNEAFTNYKSSWIS